MKKNGGITLIALIITIIILIILTAITLNNVIGTDLIGFATKAVENYTDAAEDEADKVDKLAGTLDNQGVGEDSKVRAGETVAKTEKDNYTDADGRKATIPQGFKVSTKSSEQYIKDGLVIQDSDGNEFVWVPCYYEDTENTKPEGTAEDVQKYESHTYTGKDDTAGSTVEIGGTWRTYYYTSFKDWLDTATQKLEDSEIVPDADAYGNKSVRDYGGFYIARYEAGLPEEKQPTTSQTEYDSTSTSKNTTEYGKPISKANKFSWNFISQKTALKVAEKMYEGSSSVDSKLVDGTAWDTITNWIATDGEKIVTESKTYGNYLDNGSDYTGWYAEHVAPGDKGSATYTGWLYATNFTNDHTKLQWVRLSDNGGTLWDQKQNNYTNSENCDINKNNLDTRIEIPTGSYDGFKLKNIYDLAGNMWEWTTEVGDPMDAVQATNGSLFAVFRGGSFNYDGTNNPLCCRYGDNNSSTVMDVDIGFRVVLYIK